MTLFCIILILFAAVDLAECDWSTLTKTEKIIELVIAGLTVFVCGWLLVFWRCA